MKTMYRICSGITKLVSWVSMAAISVMVLLVFADVILRKIFTVSIIGVTEITQMLWVCIILGWGVTVYGSNNLKIDMLVDRFGPRARNLIDIVITLFMIVVAFLMARQSYLSAMSNMANNTTFSLLGVPKYPFICVIALGMLLGVVGMIGKICVHIASLKGQDWADAVLGGKES